MAPLHGGRRKESSMNPNLLHVLSQVAFHRKLGFMPPEAEGGPPPGPPGGGLPPGGPPGPGGPGGAEGVMAMLAKALESDDPKIQALIKQLIMMLHGGGEEGPPGPGGPPMGGPPMAGPPGKEGSVNPFVHGFLYGMRKTAFNEEAPYSSAPNSVGWNPNSVPAGGFAEAFEAARQTPFLARQFGGPMQQEQQPTTEVPDQSMNQMRPLDVLLSALSQGE